MNGSLVIACGPLFIYWGRKKLGGNDSNWIRRDVVFHLYKNW